MILRQRVYAARRSEIFARGLTHSDSRFLTCLMNGDDDDNFEPELEPTSPPPSASVTEHDELVAERAPQAQEITDVNFHELDLP